MAIAVYKILYLIFYNILLLVRKNLKILKLLIDYILLTNI